MQNQIVDLIASEDIEQAKALLTQHAMSLQDEVLAALSELINFQTAAAHDSVLQTRQAFEQARSLTTLMSSFAFLIAGYLTWLVRNAARQRREYLAQMQAANRAKSSFLAKMSHEMRTPLTAIIGFAEESLEHEQSVQERTAALHIIRQSGSHLLHIINDILDLSKIEAEKLEVDPCECSLFALLNDVQALVSMQAQSKQLEFSIHYDFPLPVNIFTDPLRLKQIVINLCSNALKFTSVGFVRIKVGFDRDQGRLTIAVQDSGIGLTLSEQSWLFQDFHQADAGVQRKYGGTGLGLALSQKLAGMLGGKIHLTSEKDLGSTFTLELPQSTSGEFVFAATTLAGEPQRTKVDEARHFAGRVLCAEDTPELAKLIGLLLRRVGVTAEIVQNGTQAVERATRERFDLILMDIQMPVLDGVSAMTKLKESGCDTPVIAVTANAMKEDREHYRAVGFTDFLVKPIDRLQLRRVLETYLRVGVPETTPIYAKFSNADDANDEHVHRVVATFIDRLPEYCQQLTRAIASRDWQPAREVAHQLCGLGGDMGYPIITELASALSSVLKAENLTDAERINARLKSAAESIQLGRAGRGAAEVGAI